MSRFRRRPAEIDAIQWTGSNFPDVADLVTTRPGGREPDVIGAVLRLYPRQGSTLATPGDWILVGADDALEVQTDALFCSLYEPAHRWRSTIPGEPLDQGGRCDVCGRYASEAAEACGP